MMGNDLLQPSLNGGELAENLYGRVDLQRYANSLAFLENWVVQPFGGLRNRAGFRYTGTVKNSVNQVRLVPFQWSQGQGYLLEIGNYYVRIWSNPTGASAGCAPLTVATSSLSAYSATATYPAGAIVTYGGGAWTSRQAANIGNTPASGSWWYPLPVFNATSYLLELPTPWPSTALFPSGGTQGLKWAQSGDILTVVHPNYPPQQIERLGPTTAGTGLPYVAWACIPFANLNGPWQTLNSNPAYQVWASAPSGTAASPVTIYASNPAVFANVAVGQLFYLQTQNYGTQWQVSVAHAIGDIVLSAGYYYLCVSGGTTGTSQPINATGFWNDGGCIWEYLGPGYGSLLVTSITNAGNTTQPYIQGIPQGRLPDLAVMNTSGGSPVTITSVSNYTWRSGAVQFSITVSGSPTWTNGSTIFLNLSYNDIYGNPQTYQGTATINYSSGSIFYLNLSAAIFGAANYATLTGTAQLVTTSGTSGCVGLPTSVWGVGAWGGNQGYPSVVSFHQQRQIFANTPAQPQTVWMSRTGGYLDFGQNIPIQDDDGLTFTIASTQVNAITGFLPMQALVIFTTGGEWMCTGSNQLAITPSSLQLILQGFRGSSQLPPVAVGNTALFIQNKGNQVRNLQYQFMTNTYSGDDVTIWANHLFEGHTIEDWCYQQIPNSCFWMVRDDGMLLGLTYQMEQQISAWHHHGTVGGTIESVAVISEPPEDVLYVLVNRTINGSTLRTIERMNTRTITDIKESFFVDGGLSFEGRTQTMHAGANTAWGNPTMTITGGTTWGPADGLLTLTCSIPAFKTGLTGTNPNIQVGDQVVFVDASGIRYALTIWTITSTTVATGTLNRILLPAYQGLAQSAWAWAPASFSGLTNLIGQTVSILGEGFVLAQQVVSSTGTITLSSPCYRVHAGLPIYAQGQMLPVYPTAQPGDTSMAKFKGICAVRMLLDESLGIQAGRSFTNMNWFKQLSPGLPYDVPMLYDSGFAVVRIQGEWQQQADVCFQQSQPLPCSLLALIPEVTVGSD